MIPAPEGTQVHIQFRRDDGSVYELAFDVAAFDDAGFPLVVNTLQYRSGLVPPHELGGTGRWHVGTLGRRATIPAEPGWHAIVAFHEGTDIDSDLARFPVVAWRGSLDEYAGSAIVVAMADDMTNGPFDVVAYAERCDNASLIGYYHPSLSPEPAAGDLEQEVAQHRARYLEREDKRRARQAARAAA